MIPSPAVAELNARAYLTSIGLMACDMLRLIERLRQNEYELQDDDYVLLHKLEELIKSALQGSDNSKLTKVTKVVSHQQVKAREDFKILSSAWKLQMRKDQTAFMSHIESILVRIALREPIDETNLTVVWRAFENLDDYVDRSVQR